MVLACSRFIWAHVPSNSNLLGNNLKDAQQSFSVVREYAVRIPVGTPAQVFVIERLASARHGTAPGLDLRHAPIDGEIRAGDI